MKFGVTPVGGVAAGYWSKGFNLADMAILVTNLMSKWPRPDLRCLDCCFV